MMYQRYRVRRARDEENDDRLFYLMTEDDLPCPAVNYPLIMRQSRRAKPYSGEAYYLCDFLNAMSEQGIEYLDATMSDIYHYLWEDYISTDRKDHKGKSVMDSKIDALNSLYTSLVMQGYKIDSSLYMPEVLEHILMAPIQKKRGVKVIHNKNERIVLISQLKQEFRHSKNERSQSEYTKWYSKDEIEAIASELPLTYRCVFLDTVLTGHRVDSALSLTMDTVDLQRQEVTPTRTKTGQIHTSWIPDNLADMMSAYLIGVRASIVDKTGSVSDFFFLSRDGRPLTYNAYVKALETARVNVNQKFGMNIVKLHTHAGRSTFAAALRSYQLEKRRNGERTFSDDDFCKLMDWKSLDCLDRYDSVTRVQEVTPLLQDFYMEVYEWGQMHNCNV